MTRETIDTVFLVWCHIGLVNNTFTIASFWEADNTWHVGISVYYGGVTEYDERFKLALIKDGW